MGSFMTIGMFSEWYNQMRMAYIFLRVRIWLLIKSAKEKIITGASWMKAKDKRDAVTKWESAVEQGETHRI